MDKDVRREELGRFFLDLSKYVSTVVVIGSLVSEVINVRALLVGLGIGVAFTVTGYWTLPPRSKEKEGKNS
jgi:hypothetical protein